MDFKKNGKVGYQFVSIVIKWGFQICAFVAGLFALAVNGFYSLANAFHFSHQRGLKEKVRQFRQRRASEKNIGRSSPELTRF